MNPNNIPYYQLDSSPDLMANQSIHLKQSHSTRRHIPNHPSINSMSSPHISLINHSLNRSNPRVKFRTRKLRKRITLFRRTHHHRTTQRLSITRRSTRTLRVNRTHRANPVTQQYHSLRYINDSIDSISSRTLTNRQVRQNHAN